MSAIKELAVWLATYGVLYPAIHDLGDPDDALEIEAKIFAAKIKRLVRGNIRPGSAPKEYEAIEGWEHIRDQYAKDGVHPTRIMAEAHALATLATKSSDKGIVNNITTAMSIPAAWIDLGERFRNLPLLTAKQAAEFVDLAWKHVEKDTVRRSMDAAEEIAKYIKEAR